MRNCAVGDPILAVDRTSISRVFPSFETNNEFAKNVVLFPPHRLWQNAEPLGCCVKSKFALIDKCEPVLTDIIEKYAATISTGHVIDEGRSHDGRL